MPFSPGDVVRLKSGGPSMTVRRVAEDGDVVAVWFPDPRAELQERRFAPDTLVREPRGDGGYASGRIDKEVTLSGVKLERAHKGDPRE